MVDSAPDAEPPDGLLGGRLRLYQPSSGHRAGTDAVMLAAAARNAQGLIIDMGAGVGTAGLAVALGAPAATVRLVEIDPALAELARRNILLNGLQTRATCFCADLLSPASRRAAGLVDAEAELVLSNPPFYAAERVRSSPDAARRLAHVAPVANSQIEEFLSRWLRACVAHLAPHGRLLLIHRANAIGELLAGLQGRAGAIRLLPLHPRADQPATRLLVSAVKGSRATPTLLPPLVLHEADGRFTALAEAIHRGEASIGL